MKRYFLLMAVVLVCSNINSQDLNFSQFYEQPLLRNPALAGIFDCNFRVKSVYRNQWQKVTVPYRTAGLSVEMKFPGNNSNWHNFGLQVMYDVAGDSRLTRIMVLPGYSYHLQTGDRSYLSFGALAGPVSSHFDVSKLTWNDQYVNDQYLPTNPTMQLLKNTSKTYLDVAVGIVYSRPVFDQGDLYIGTALYHANSPVVSYDAALDNRLDRKFGVNAGMTAPSGGRNAVTMYGDAFFQGGHRQIMFGGFYTFSLADEYYDDQNKSSLHVGGVYRWDDAVIPVVRLDKGQFSVGLSYDVNISKLKTASQSRGGFELTLSYRNCLIGGDRNGLPCPKFGSIF